LTAGFCRPAARVALGDLLFVLDGPLTPETEIQPKFEEIATGAFDTLESWAIDWGDGTTSEGTGPVLPTKVFEEEGSYRIQVTLRTAEGVFTRVILVSVGRMQPVVVEDVVATTGAVEIVFSREIRDVWTGAPDGRNPVRLVGPDGTEITGVVLLSEDGTRLRFVPDGGDLAPGSYQLEVTSSLDGVIGLLGCALDGDRDGMPGGHFITTFTLNVEEARARDAVVPVIGRNLAGLAEVTLDVALPPGLHGTVSAGAGLPDGGQVFTEDLPGGLRLMVTAPEPFEQDAAEIAKLHLVEIPSEQATAAVATAEPRVLMDAVAPALLVFGGGLANPAKGWRKAFAKADTKKGQAPNQTPKVSFKLK